MQNLEELKTKADEAAEKLPWHNLRNVYGATPTDLVMIQEERNKAAQEAAAAMKAWQEARIR